MVLASDTPMTMSSLQHGLDQIVIFSCSYKLASVMQPRRDECMT